MNMTVRAAFFLLLACAVPLNSIAAAYELIPSSKRMDETSNGRVYVYRVFYVDNKKQRISVCFANLTQKDKTLKLECGAVVALTWKLAESSQIHTKMVGRFDYAVDDDTIPFGLWQVDESTGDWQFCISGDLAVENNCVLSHVP